MNLRRVSVAVALALLSAVMPLGLSSAFAAGPGTWTATGSLATARYLHTETLLPSGKVLVAGGVGGGAAELYDPATGTWTATGSLATARIRHTATLLPSGKVLVAGGSGVGGAATASAELYDPATGTWTATGSLAIAREQHTATLLPSGKVLVAGGFVRDTTYGMFHYVVPGAELYDPATGTWTATGSPATARYSHTATLLSNGKVLVAGGLDTSNLMASAELYDPATGTWTATGSLATARFVHTATLLPNGKVLVAGGSGGGSATAAAELYDPATGTWTATGSLATARYYHTATLLSNGKVLVAGGLDTSNLMASAELYDPATGTWTATGSLATARFAHTATLLPSGKVLVAGGRDANFNAMASAELYEPVPDNHSLTVTPAGGGSGTATTSPEGIDCGTDCTQDYAHGTSVTLNATPAADSVFAGWSGGGCSGTGACIVTMDAAKAVTATFEIAQRTVTVARNGGGTGTVTSSPDGVDCGADCSQDYAHGTSVTLTAAPAPDSAFAGWSGGGCSGTGACVVTTDAAKQVTATFEIAQRTLTVVQAGGGGGTVTSSPGGIDCGADCTESYSHGTLVTLTATPAPGSNFVGWSGICTGAGTCAITMDAAKTVTANFARIPRSSRALTVAKSGGGEGDVTSSPLGIDCGSDCTQVYEDGMTITLTAAPEGLSSFGSWTGCDRVIGNECVVTMNVDTTVTARFVAPRTLTVERGGTGSGEVTSQPGGIDCGGQCEAEYVNGSEVVLTAVPGEGSTFGSWSGCDEVSDDECTVSLTSDTTVTVRFDGARVVYPRRVSLFLGRHLIAHGRVWVGEGPVACAARVPVKVQRKTAKGWVTEERRLTSEDGKFRVRLVDRLDSYRVSAPAVKIDGGPDACANAVSPVREHGHE